tara:strand:+ start:3366 stop:3791 length:426 start_codon:yes stop_codon:yes gene_type:complete
MNKRECGTCTKCCEGYLSGKVNGKEFYKGRPCFYVSINKGCNIYEKRPNDPCKVYSCFWKDYDVLPYWMKPSEVHVICSFKSTSTIKKMLYLEVREAGEILSDEVLNWVKEYSFNNGINLQYQKEGNWYRCGSVEFTKEYI